MLIQVSGFPTGQTVNYQVIDRDANVITAWTGTGVTERTIDATLSIYVYEAEYTFTTGFTGYVLWKTTDNVWSATEYIDEAKSSSLLTSSSTDFALTRSKIIKRAFRKAGIVGAGQNLEPEMNEDGIELLNLIIHEDLPNEGIRLWQREWATKTFTASSEVTGSDGNIYTCIRSHTSAATNKPVTGANWSTYWELAGSTGGTWITSTDYAAIGDFVGDTDLLDIEQAFLRQNGVDLPLDIISINKYLNIVDKSITGTPSTLVIERSKTPRIYTWPQPNNTDDVLHYLKIRKLQDFDNTDDAPDLPQYAYHSLIKILAYQLTFDYPSSAVLRNDLRIEKEMALNRLKKQDAETEDYTMIEPCYEN